MKNSEFIKQMQSVQLDILVDFKRVCDNHNIKFYLAYGTCIGAIRHKGFIPWDDDIDVMMTVDEIEKFKKVCHELKSDLFFQSHENEQEYGLLIYRIRNSNTTLIESDHIDRDINHGVYIDIYPLMNSAQGAVEKRLVRLSMLFYRLFIYNAPPVNKGKKVKFISTLILRVTPNFIKNRLCVLLSKYLYSRKSCNKYSTLFTISRGSQDYPSEWFKEPTYLSFEGIRMPVPTFVHEYLSSIYGDYMTLPPEEKREMHHDYVFADFKNSYINYRGIKYCINKQ